MNSDWLELVVFLHTNEQDGERVPHGQLYGRQQVCATLGIENFQEQQKAVDMFFEGNDVSVSLFTGYL